MDSIGLFQSEIINKNNYVCQKHFLKEHITSSNHLIKNAVPILNITQRLSNDENQNTTDLDEGDLDLRTEKLIMAPSNLQPCMSSVGIQTNRTDEDIELLQIMDKISYHHYAKSDEDSFMCQKCLKSEKLIQFYKRKLKKCQRNFRVLKSNNSNIKRVLNRMKLKHNKLKKIDDHIDNLNVNEMTKNVCKLLVKEDFYYDEKDKLFAQSLFYKSASTYRYLRDQMNLKLPSTSSIYKWAPIKFIPPGINEILINQLKKVFENMTVSSKMCVLSLDEMCIKKDLTVNTYLDRVEGFCDDGRERKSELATSVLFFMLRGLVDDWKYVLSYVLINNSSNPTYLSELVKEQIRISNEELKLNVVMVTCDQAATNIAAYKILGITPETPYFYIKDSQVFAQFDPPHLLKSFRNAFLKNKIEHSDFGVSTINVIKKIFDFDSIQNVKLMPKLTIAHFEPNTFQKMNVRLAAELMSSTVASAIRTTLKVKPEIFGEYLDNAIPTAQLVQTVNDLFDCLNCRHFHSTAPFERPLAMDNDVYKCLEKSLTILDQLKIISKNENYFKFIKGFKITIKAQILLVEMLKNKFDVKYILTGRTNQDCLEKNFSMLRGKGGFYYMPSSFEIGVHFANIIVRKITLNSPFQNCMVDESTTIDLYWENFKEEFESSLKSQELSSTNIVSDTIIEATDIHIIKENSLTYYTGYCIFKKIKCQCCRDKLLKSDDEIKMSDTFLMEKNFTKNDSNFGSLRAPSDEFCDIARLLVQIFEKYYRQHCSSPNIIKSLTDECLKIIKQKYPSFLPDENEECYEHLKNLIHFFNLVLIRKNFRWSILNNEFTKTKSRTSSSQACRKLKILKN